MASARTISTLLIVAVALSGLVTSYGNGSNTLWAFYGGYVTLLVATILCFTEAKKHDDSTKKQLTTAGIIGALHVAAFPIHRYFMLKSAKENWGDLQ